MSEDLLEVTRGGAVESVHRGTVVLLAPDGSVAAALGDPDEIVFPRSALKPLQASAMARAGFAGGAPELALASASHSGGERHRAGVRAVLAAAGLDESALRCPADLPFGRDELVAYVAGGGRAARVCHNCSGKHAAMVATCVSNGWDVAGYLDPAHPLQQAVVAEIETACGARIVRTSVDGCGAPAHALPLVALARGFAHLTTATEGPAAAVAAGIRANPVLLGGEERPVTDFVAEVDGLVAKDGAEGVWAAALPDGRAMAAKVADGAARALPPVLAAVLGRWGFAGPAVRRWSSVPVPGGDGPGNTVGEIRWSAPLRALVA